VTPTAIAIPAAPNHVPSRACAGEERNFNARMKVTIVTR
jgi:hypothetical protein